MTSTSPEVVGVFGTGSPPGITVRDVTAVPGGSNSRLVYRAQLLVVPGANSSPGAWIQGENVRYLELTLTPDGWGINRVSPQPITG